MLISCGLWMAANEYRRLRKVQPSHAVLTDIQEKSEFFDTAAAKYSPRVSS